MSQMPNHQEDIKLLIERTESFTGQAFHGFNTYRRTTVAGRIVKVPIGNCPVMFSPGRKTPDGYYYAWCSDTQENRAVIRKLVDANLLMIDRPEYIGDWDDGKKVEPEPDAEVEDYSAPDESPLDADVFAEGYTRAFLEVKSARKLRLILDQAGISPPLKATKEELIKLILGE